jgi:TP901 family phage tail tape measure protein
MYRDNLQGFDQIGAAMAKVHNDLGLVGDDADAATAKFLKFSTATGQDAAAAIAQADDTLDAFNLTADDADELLDKLIVSHQKYGGVISESEAALAAMAPALGAANLGLDDGIALLNLFNAAGVDAAKMPQALAKALAKVKSPEELRRLLTDIGQIEDPFERAAKATEIFGARAGPQLAQALAQGNLDDFRIDMDEAAGATEKAAEAIESGFGAQFKLLLKNAGGALAEFGQNFGPLLMLASAFGPQLTKAIGAGLGGLAGAIGPRLVKALAAVLPFAITSGAAQGTAMGTAAAASATATEAAGVTAGQAVVATTATPAAAAAGKTLGTAMGLAAKAAFLLAIAGIFFLALDVSGINAPKHKNAKGQTFRGTNDPLEQLKNLEDAAARARDRIAGGETGIVETQLRAIEAEIERLRITTGEAVGAVTEEIGRAGDDWEREAAAAADQIGEGIAGRRDALRGEMQSVERELHLGLAMLSPDLRQDAIDAMSSFAEGLLSKRTVVDSAMEQLATATENTMSRVAEVAKLVGLLTGQELADGLAANDPVVHAQAEETRAIIENRLMQLGVEAKSWGEDAQTALTEGLASKNDAVRAQAERTNDLIERELSNHNQHRAVGGAIVDDIDAGLKDPTKAGKLGATAGALARAITRGLLGGILSGATPAVRTALSNSIGFQAFAGGGDTAAGVPILTGERGPEIFVPNVAGHVLTAAETRSASRTMGGNTYSTTLVMPAPPTRDPFEALERASFYQRHGIVNPAVE